MGVKSQAKAKRVKKEKKAILKESIEASLVQRNKNLVLENETMKEEIKALKEKEAFRLPPEELYSVYVEAMEGGLIHSAFPNWEDLGLTQESWKAFSMMIDNAIIHKLWPEKFGHRIHPCENGQFEKRG